VWGLDADPEGKRLVAAFSEPQLEVFRVAEEKQGGERTQEVSGRTLLHSLGMVLRSTPERAAALLFHPTANLLACLGAGKSVELFRSVQMPPWSPQF
jgi:hypothetical protein